MVFFVVMIYMVSYAFREGYNLGAIECMKNLTQNLNITIP